MTRGVAKLGALVAVVAFVGGIVWLNVAAFGVFAEQRRLDDDGVRAVGDVVATQETDVPRSDGQWVTVRFDVLGEPVTVSLEVDLPTLERAIRSGRLAIVHDPHDPTVVSVVGDGRAGTMAVTAGVVDVTLVGGVVALVANDRKREADGTGMTS